MKTAKIGAIFLVATMALAGVGAGYALWWDDLFVDGYIETGWIGCDWSVGIPWDDETKEYSWAEAYIMGDTLYVDIYNAYPCVTYYIPIDIHCTGTIPIHIWWDGVINPPDFPGTITMTDFHCQQLHPDESLWGEITVHLDNNAQQGVTYTFCTTLVYHQYNEAYPPQ